MIIIIIIMSRTGEGGGSLASVSWRCSGVDRFFEIALSAE